MGGPYWSSVPNHILPLFKQLFYTSPEDTLPLHSNKPIIAYMCKFCWYTNYSLIRALLTVTHSWWEWCVVESHFWAISFRAINRTIMIAIYVWGVHSSSSSQPNRQSLGSKGRVRFHILLIDPITFVQYLINFGHFHRIWIRVPLSTSHLGHMVECVLYIFLWF